MVTTRSVVFAFWAASTILGVDAANGQEYPSKAIRIITSTPSSSTNVTARMIAQGITGPLGQPVIVENRSTIAATAAVAEAQPDGYSLLVAGGTTWTLPLLESDASWDPIKAFAPITLAIRSPNILVVNASLPVKSVKELIAYTKARPGQLNYAGSSPGSSTHLTMELFKSMAGLNVVPIHYKEAGDALTALSRGDAQMTFDNPVSLLPLVHAGKLRALAVASAQPFVLTPDLPTMVASGMPGFISGSMHGVWAPAKTSDAIVRRLNQEMVRVLNDPDVKQKALSTGAETVGDSPEDFASIIKADMALWSKVIKDANIHVQ